LLADDGREVNLGQIIRSSAIVSLGFVVVRVCMCMCCVVLGDRRLRLVSSVMMQVAGVEDSKATLTRLRMLKYE
jgi:hypothetical protein